MTLSPSTARTYLVPTAANTGAGYYVPSSIVVATKSSADIIDYTFDFTNWLSGTFDSIVEPVSLSGPLADGAYPVTMTENAISGNLVTFVLASGQPNTTNILGLKVNTAQGRTVVVPFTLTIDGASPPTAYVDPGDNGNTNTGVGVSSITAEQGPVTAGSNTTLSLLFKMTDGTTQTVQATLPSGATGVGVKTITATPNPENSTLTNLTFAMTDGTTQVVAVPLVTQSPTDGGTPGVGISSVTTTPGSAANTVNFVFALTDGSKDSVPVTLPSGSDGVGIKEITVQQPSVIAGQTSTATLTFAMTDGSSQTASISVPAGATGNSTGGTGGSAVTSVAALSGGDVTLTPDTTGAATAFTVTINGAGALTIAAPATKGVRQVLFVEIIQTGDFAFTLPGSDQNVSYPGGTPFTIPTIAGRTYVTYVTYDGINWAGFLAP